MLRSLRRNPGFAAAFLLTLGLGIGASTLVFSIVHSLLIRPLPYPEPDSLVRIWTDNRRAGLPRDTTSIPTLNNLQSESGVFSAVAPFTSTTLTYAESGDPYAITVVAAGSQFFDAMAVMPAIGRNLAPGDDKLGAEDVAILEHTFWRTALGGDPNVIGKPLRLNRRDFRVVGVMPSGFQYPEKTRAWVNLPSMVRSPEPFLNREWTIFEAIARTRKGVALGAARDRVTVVADDLRRRFPTEYAETSIAIVPLRDQILGDVPAMLWMSFATVVAVLMVGCVNLAGLQLVRTSVRRTEFAVRAALGASGVRLIGGMLAESLLLAAGGCALGAALAYAGVRAFVAFDPVRLPRNAEIQFGWETLLFAVAVAGGSGILFGLAPAIDVARVPLASVLRGASTAGARGIRLREAMLSAQIALAFVLAAGAVFLVRGFAALERTNTGMDVRSVLTFKLGLPSQAYFEEAPILRFYRDLIRELEATPGIRSAGVGTYLLQSTVPTTMLAWEGSLQKTEVSMDIVSPGYFKTLGIPILDGRAFALEERTSDAIVNQSLAKRLWPGENPIGKRVRDLSTNHVNTIIGVVADSRPNGPDVEPKPRYYTNLLKRPLPEAEAFVRFDPAVTSPEAVIASVRDIVKRLDRGLALEEIELLEQGFDHILAARRTSSRLVASLAAFAVLLAALGAYGVIHYQLQQRKREIGVRMALGASMGTIWWQVQLRTLLWVAIGVSAGIAAAFAMSRAGAAQLPAYANTSPPDPWNLAGAALWLVAAALLGAAIPALRAARMSPMEALRDS